MKRANKLFDKIVERDNLSLAVSKASRGKRHRSEVQDFMRNLNANMNDIRVRIVQENYPFGNYHQFMIFDPKQRLITAPSFAERVVHHAIMNVCEDVLERSLIHDSYACRTGKGREACILRAQQYSRRFKYFLKIDIRRYFDSIDHLILLNLLRSKFKEDRLLNLFDQIIQSHHRATGVGLSIGSLMSQHFANFYLSPVDRHIKEEIRVRGYVRYMDDMILWSDNSVELKAWLVKVKGFLADSLKLRFSATPYVNKCQHGIDFLGCRIYSTHCALSRRSKRRYQTKLDAITTQLNTGQIDQHSYQSRCEALTAFTKAANIKSWHFRTRVLNQ